MATWTTHFELELLYAVLLLGPTTLDDAVDLVASLSIEVDQQACLVHQETVL